MRPSPLREGLRLIMSSEVFVIRRRFPTLMDLSRLNESTRPDGSLKRDSETAIRTNRSPARRLVRSMVRLLLFVKLMTVQLKIMITDAQLVMRAARNRRGGEALSTLLLAARILHSCLENTRPLLSKKSRKTLSIVSDTIRLVNANGRSIRQAGFKFLVSK